MKRIFLLTLVAFVSLGFENARAEVTTGKTTCFGFRNQDVTTTIPPETLSPVDVQKKLWCYREVTSPRPATFIFNADESEVRYELSALVEPDGTLTHSSLLKGERTLHKIKSRFSPLGVPLKAPETGMLPEKTDEKFQESADRVLEYLMSGRGAKFHAMGVTEGRFMASATAIEAAHMPFRGFWWSFAGGKLHTGPDSPLAKYDRYVAARTGQPSLAQIWESVKHQPDGNPWSGHCNGWAASSIIRPEPTAPITDPVSGVTFTIGDQKGILASKDNCIQAAFFGSRYNGWRGETMDDIYPADFHDVILYYIGQLRKPIAMDRFRNASVDNHVASGFDMKIKREGDHFDVTVILNMHKYDAGPDKPPGPAPLYTKEFKYRMWLDGRGIVIKSEWLTENNPDFIWVPLAPVSCDHGNPYVTEQYVDMIFGY